MIRCKVEGRFGRKFEERICIVFIIEIKNQLLKIEADLF